MLITCPECKKEISKDAIACPHCGKKLNKTEVEKAILVISIAGIIYYIITMIIEGLKLTVY